MAFANESFSNQSSVLKVSVMVVDDDPIFLQIMSRMLEKSKDRGQSHTEITVIAARDSVEALSTLKFHRNNIDLIITDYYMPGMNGIQLKNQITQEFGNLPVIVISSDTNKEEESLNCGAMCFIPKPIKPNDLTKIYQHAITYKRNGKSIVSTEENHKDKDANILQQIEALPDVANVMVNTKKKKKYSSSVGSDSQSVNTVGSSGRTDGSRKNRKIKPNDGSGDDDDVSRPSKKKKITWTNELHDQFLQAIRHIGLDKAVPKKILEFMNNSDLTRENIASHLQKYRIFLRKVADEGMLHSNVLPVRSMREPYYNYFTPSSSWYETSLNNRSFYTNPGHGLGQSRLLSNTRDQPIRFNQTSPYSYGNRSSVYEPQGNGFNLTQPIKSTNFSISNQPSQNEGHRSFFEVNKTVPTSQVVGFGQHGQSAVNDMMSSYGSVTPTQPGLTSYGRSSSTQPGLSSFARLPPNQPRVVSSFESLMSKSGVSSTPNQAGLSGNGSLTPNQPVAGRFGSSTPNQSRLSSFGILTPNQQRPSSYGSLTPNQSGASSLGNLTFNQPGLSGFGSLAPNQPGLSSYQSLTPNQSGVSSLGNSTPNQPGLSGFGSLTPNQSGLSSFGTLPPNQPGLGSFGSFTPNQPGLRSFGSLTSNQSGVSSFGSFTPNQSRLSSFRSLTPNQPGGSKFGSLTPIQPGPSTFESFTPNQLGPSNFESLTSNQPASSNFSFDIQSFLNNEDEAYNPAQPHANANTQPNLEISPLENLNIFDDLDSINALPLETNNFQIDHNKPQGEDDFSNFDLPALPTQLNQTCPIEEEIGGDVTFMNNQVHNNGDISSNFVPETVFPNFNINSTNQEEEAPDYIDWAFLDRQDLVGDDLMDSLVNNGMN